MGRLHRRDHRSEGEQARVAHLDRVGGRHASDGSIHRRIRLRRPRRDGRPMDDSSRFFRLAMAGRAQIWLLSRNGGEARRVSNLENGASNFEWSPDGDTLRLPDAHRSAAEQDERRAPLHAHLLQVQRHRIFRRKAIARRDRRRAAPARRSRSPTATIGTTSIRTGRPIRRASRSFRTAPATNSTSITTPTSGPFQRPAGRSRRFPITSGPDRSPRWSPDGKRIAFLGAEDEEAPPLIYVAPADGRQSIRALNKTFDQAGRRPDVGRARQGDLLRLRRQGRDASLSHGCCRPAR